MDRRWGLLIGFVGAVWLLGSGHGGRQPPETAAQRCFCQVRGVRGVLPVPVLPASAVRSVLCAPAGERRGDAFLRLQPLRVECFCSSAGAESSAARLVGVGRSPTAAWTLARASDQAWGKRCGCTLYLFTDWVYAPLSVFPDRGGIPLAAEPCGFCFVQLGLASDLQDFLVGIRFCCLLAGVSEQSDSLDFQVSSCLSFAGISPSIETPATPLFLLSYPAPCYPEEYLLLKSEVSGYLDDCTCDVETIDRFNNYRLFPRLQKLLESDYFRYYKVNLKRPCPFWNDISQCGRRDCAVRPCQSDEVPDGIKSTSYKYSEEANSLTEECERAERLGAVDESLSEETQKAVLQWTKHDDSSDNFCEADDIQSPDAEYVDLLLNPERYTGYKGPDAWKIWNVIYEENCFKPQTIKRPLNPLVSGQENTFYSWLEGLCVEKRAFYRLISGLHASINVHLSARYLLQDTWLEKKWGHNVTEFQQRFDAILTEGEGPRRLKNLYFLYLIELRALSKVVPFFERPDFQLFTGNKIQDAENKMLLLEILHEIKRTFDCILEIFQESWIVLVVLNVDCGESFRLRVWNFYKCERIRKLQELVTKYSLKKMKKNSCNPNTVYHVEMSHY
ncbi:hypothetical protein HPG69_012014 [Diceros bicornis minor]|uniref:ERO1-like protein alpha n=1 Tax=Diceros bicornis minor TaxID=77932 RepID=A0A7J7EHN2_DICBM|nr:hypothetical protein HPG69_012014 [Diceros bicornis minor]